MNTESRITDLLLRWEEARDQGRTLSPEELCRDCPELLDEVKRRLAALQSIDRRFQRDGSKENKMPNVPASAVADKNLLFGILAVQMDFISRDQLIAAMNAWVLDKSKSLGTILMDQTALEAGRHALLEALVQEHLKQHDNDPHKSLAAVSSLGSVRGDLQKIADADLEKSLGQVSLARKDDDPYATVTNTVGESTSAGTRFRILRPHARGGLGEVFVAHDEELHREVALKEIQDRYADNLESRSRFLLEAEITGGLEHPGIVPVYGLGQYADGRPFYAMRFIKGDSLKDAIERFHKTSGEGRVASGERVVEFRKLLGRFIDVCNAIAYAHSRGVLHRDLKPGNIMLGKYGETLVVDWGLAKPVDRPEKTTDLDEHTLRPSSVSGSAETQAGSAIGTPQYMSPEQAAGRLDLLGPASDVYSLGATLYCLLTGKAPFEGKDIGAVLGQVQRGEFPRPKQIKSDVPAPLEAICLTAMALTPKDRYVSPRALADDLEHWLADEPVSAWPEPWTVRARRWVGRHRVVATGASAALLVGVLSLLIATGLLARQRDKVQEANRNLKAANEELDKEKEQAVNARKQAEVAEKEAIANAEEARKQTLSADTSRYSTQIELAQREWRDNDVLAARRLLEECRFDLRSWEHHFVWTLCRRKMRVLSGHRDHITSLALSSDGNLLASASWDKTIKIWEMKNDRESRTLKGHTDRIQKIVFSPGGKYLASVSWDKTVRVWEVESGKEAVPAKTSHVRGLTFSPDGKRLLLAASTSLGKIPKWQPCEVVAWDIVTNKQQFIAKVSAGDFLVAFSPDGRRLASSLEGSGSERGQIKVWNLETGREILAFNGFQRYPTTLAFSPDSKRLAGADGNGKVGEMKVWDAENGNEVLNRTGLIDAVSFSSDSKRLVCSSSLGMIHVLDLSAGSEILSFNGHMGGIMGVSCALLHPSGSRLAWAGGRGLIVLFNTGTSPESMTLNGHSGAVACVAFSPDSKRLASASAALGGDGDTSDQEVRVWDSTTGKTAFILKHSGSILCVAFSQDDRLLATANSSPQDGAGKVRLWNASTGKEIRTLGSPGAHFYSGLSFSPDGSRLAALSEQAVKIWEVATGQELLKIDVRGTGRIAFSTDGKYVAAGCSGGIHLWETSSGKLVRKFNLANSDTFGVAFSADGKLLAGSSGPNNVEIKIWAVSSGQEILTLEQTGRARAMDLAFTPDSKRLAVAATTQEATNEPVRCFDVGTGQLVLSVKAHAQGGISLAISADGRRLATGGIDGSVKICVADLPLHEETIEHYDNLSEAIELLRRFERARDVRGCRAIAEMWEKRKQTNADNLYQLSCFRAITAKVIRVDYRSRNAKAADAEADRAMVWLRQAVSAGFNNFSHMKSDKDLDSLRDREDFKKLVAELEAKGKKK